MVYRSVVRVGNSSTCSKACPSFPRPHTLPRCSDNFSAGTNPHLHGAAIRCGFLYRKEIISMRNREWQSEGRWWFILQMTGIDVNYLVENALA
jgi:hypothetical protein